MRGARMGIALAPPPVGCSVKSTCGIKGLGVGLLRGFNQLGRLGNVGGVDVVPMAILHRVRSEMANRGLPYAVECFGGFSLRVRGALVGSPDRFSGATIQFN